MDWLQWIIIAVLIGVVVDNRRQLTQQTKWLTRLHRENDLLKKVAIYPDDLTIGDKLVEANARDRRIAPQITPEGRLKSYKEALKGMPREHMYSGSAMEESRLDVDIKE